MSYKQGMQHSVLDAALIVAGSLVFALGIVAFEAPYGLAAGGLTGLAVVIQRVCAQVGIAAPLGLQTIVMNAVLMVPVVRTGGIRYAWRTLLGIVASSVFVDVLSPLVPPLGDGDLLLCALWGGVVCGIGLGMAFRGGGNTGGVDIIAQLVSRRTAMSVGTVGLAADLAVIALSIPVFSIKNALYAAVAMFVCTHVLDYVVAGPRSEKVAWIISDAFQSIEHEVLAELHRGCTRIQATGSFSGEGRPLLFVILSRRELPQLKTIVRDVDSHALLAITDVHEAFGEGFHSIEAEGGVG